MLKIVYPSCCGMDVHKSFLSLVLPLQMGRVLPVTKTRDFLLSWDTGAAVQYGLQNCLTVSNIKLDDVFSDVFGKTAMAINTRLLAAK